MDARRGLDSPYQALFAASLDAVLLTSPDGGILDANEAACRLFGRTKEELVRLGRTGVVDVTDPRLAPALAERERTDAFRGELRLRRRDGSTFLAEISSAVFADPQGGWLTSMVVRDVTATRQAEEALRRSEERYRTVLADQTEVICRFLPDGTFTFVNEVFCRFIGKDAGELLGHRWQPIAVSEDVPLVEARLQSLSSTNPVVVVENRVYSGAARVHWMQFVNRGFFDQEGRLLEIQSVGRDVTERRQAEEDLRQLSGRLLQVQDEERRRMARELHDTTAQEMAALELHLGLLAAKPELSPPVREHLGLAHRLAERCSQQIRTLSYLLYPPLLEELGLADTVREYLDGFAQRSGLRTDLELPASLERLPRETELALFRVLQEALANVHRHADSRSVSVRIAHTAGEVLLEVRDRGHGMIPVNGDGAVVSSIGRLGVGIPGMRERMRQLGGRLEIESDRTGTRVRAVVPA